MIGSKSGRQSSGRKAWVSVVSCSVNMLVLPGGLGRGEPRACAREDSAMRQETIRQSNGRADTSNRALEAAGAKLERPENAVAEAAATVECVGKSSSADWVSEG